jgi:hypothetical protein
MNIKIVPTEYPVFDFYLRIWKLLILTAVLVDRPESESYEYLSLRVGWNGKRIWSIRLYDLTRRMNVREDMKAKELEKQAVKK